MRVNKLCTDRGRHGQAIPGYPRAHHGRGAASSAESCAASRPVKRCDTYGQIKSKIKYFFSKILAKFFKFFQKIEKFSSREECRICRSQKMLKNAPILAIGGFDTAENEPSKVF